MPLNSAPTSARRTSRRSSAGTTASSRSRPRGGTSLRGPRRDPHRRRHAHQARGARRAGVRRPGRVLLRGVRRRLLQGRDHRGRRRRRRRGRGGRLPHPVRREGLRHPPARRVPGLEDPAGAAVRQPQDRGDLEQAGARAHGGPPGFSPLALEDTRDRRALDARRPPALRLHRLPAQHRPRASSTSSTTRAAT